MTEMGNHGRVLSRATDLSLGLYSILLAAVWEGKGGTRETRWGDYIGPCGREAISAMEKLSWVSACISVGVQ